MFRCTFVMYFKEDEFNITLQKKSRYHELKCEI